MSKQRKLFLTSYSLSPLEKIPSCGILCEQGRIIGIGGASAFSMMEDGLEVINLTDSYALPGFIDSHIHGINDADAASADQIPDTLENISGQLVRHGVTTFCPTLSSRSPDAMLKIISAIVSQIEKGVSGADPIGIHLEGPFINKTKRGAMDSSAVFEQIDFGYARELLEAGNGRLKLQTFAPELKDAPKLVELMMEYGAIPSMGHSAASGEEALQCIDAGALRCTYIFNGMKQLYHRESSLTSMALIDDRVSVEMICDGVHLCDPMIQLIARMKGPDRMMLITDAIRACAMPDGNYSLGGLPVVVKEGCARLTTGPVAGSTLRYPNGLKRLVRLTSLPLCQAVKATSLNQALSLDLGKRGRLEKGYIGDIVLLDSSLDVTATLCDGVVKWSLEDM